jgi:dipeptide transport system substrate-binding protein
VVRKPGWLLFLLGWTLALLTAGCSRTAATPETEAPTPTVSAATAVPEITIVARERLVVGVDPSLPPLVDVDGHGDLVGLEADLWDALMDVAGMDYDWVETDWDTIFDDLITGRFDAVIGGVTSANSPEDLVDLTTPYLTIEEVAVVLESSPAFQTAFDLAGAVIGVQPLSWGEFLVTGENALIALPSGNIRRLVTTQQLVDALLTGSVDAVITHRTVVQSYENVNPGYLRLLVGPQGQDALASYRYHIAVPQGARQLLDRLDSAIGRLETTGRMAEILTAWDLAPEFSEQPRYTVDPSDDSLIAYVEKVDDYRVRIVLNRPDPYLDYKLAVPATAMHSPANLDAMGRGADLASNPVGTGPYRLQAWEAGKAITLTAFTEYWGGTAPIPQVIVRTVPDAHLRFELLRGNQAQLVENLSAEDLDGLEDKPIDEIEVRYRSPVNIAYLGMNREKPPFNQREVRMALATCIDQADLVATSYPSGTLAANQFLPPTTFGFTPGLLWHGHDTAISLAYLRSAGYDNGLSITMTVPDVSSDYLPQPHKVAEALRDQLAACRISVTLEYLSAAVFEKRLVAGQLPLHLSGWSADFPGPIGFFNLHFTGRGNGRQFGAPFPEVVSLLDQAAGSTDWTVRRDLYGEVNKLLWDKVIFVPLAHGAGNMAARSYVPGLSLSSLRHDSLAALGPITATKAITSPVFLVANEPLSLDPADEMDDATFVITSQIFETLVKLEPSSGALDAGLALEWETNETTDVWEFVLRPDVQFHDGTPFDADAVVTNLQRLWKADHPLHQGRSGLFRYFEALFGGFRQE